MRELLLNVTTSLDGFIADLGGGVGWLIAPPEDLPVEYQELMETVDTLVMGRGTYEVSLELQGGLTLFEGRRAYVFTSRDDLPQISGVSFVHERPEAFVERLKAEEGGTIWLFGGGQLATALSDAGLIDQYVIAIQPILLGNGIPLWRSPHGYTRLEGAAARVWTGGLIELRFRRSPST